MVVTQADNRAVELIEDQSVEMRDGTILKADVRRPVGGGKFPTLLLRTPYWKQHPRYAKAAHTLAARGYTVVNQDIRGRYGSEGEFLWQFMDNSLLFDAEDGYDSVEWAAQLESSDGHVGTWGHSYDAWCAWRLAELQPPSLKALHASGMGTDSLDMNFGIFETGRRLEWTYMMAADMRRRSGVAHGPQDPFEAVRYWREVERGKYIWYLPFADMPDEPFSDLTPQLKAFYSQQNVEVWKFRDIHPKVNVPTASFTGWWDRVIGTVNQFSGMVENGPANTRDQHRIVIGPWSHMMTELHRDLGPIDYGPKASENWVNLITRWYDWQLKEMDNGYADEPPVRLFVLNENRWRTENEWPLARTQYRELFLGSDGKANTPQGDGALTWDQPGDQQPDKYSYDPRDPVMSIMDVDAQAMPRNQAVLDGRHDVLVYHTAPFEQELRLIGPITVKLWAASDAVDTDFTAKLVIVHEDGVAVNLTYGIKRAQYRNGYDNPSLINPGEPYEYTIQLNPVGVLFQPGQRLRLDISSSDFPNFDRNHNTGKPYWSDAELRTANQTVFHEGSMPSRLIVPVVED